MGFKNIIHYEGKTWEYIYGDWNPRIDKSIRHELLINMFDMYSKGSSERRIRNSLIDCVVKIVGRRAISTLSGTYFKLEGEADGGRADMGILLLDQFAPELN